MKKGQVLNCLKLALFYLLHEKIAAEIAETTAVIWRLILLFTINFAFCPVNQLDIFFIRKHISFNIILPKPTRIYR